jgi:hypothetical protein
VSFPRLSKYMSKDWTGRSSSLVTMGLVGVCVFSCLPKFTSFSLSYFLADQLAHAHPTFLQLVNGECIFFGPDGVFLLSGIEIVNAVNRLGSDARPWALVDSNSGLVSMAPIFMSQGYKIFTIQTASPEGCPWKSWAKYKNARLVAMDPFSKPELLIGR